MKKLDEHVRRLAGADEAERIYAAEDIGFANRAEGAEPLFARLPLETSRAVREAIFLALQNIDDDCVTEGALGLLASEDSFLRNQAVELLRQRGPGAIPFLRRAFSRAGNEGRKFLIDVLAGVDGPGSGELYSLALADSDINVVITAVEILGNRVKTEFRERIEALAATGDPMLGGACLETLARIGNAHSLEVWRSSAGSGGPVADFLLPSYLRLLGAHGGEGAIAEAAAMLESRGTHLHASILDAIAAVRQRYPAAPLPEFLTEPLERIVRNSASPHLRRQALRLLSGLVGHDGVAAFLEQYQDMDMDSVALGEHAGV